LVRQAKPGLSRKLKGAYSWNDPFTKIAEQACGIGVIRDTKPCEAKLRAAAKANPVRPRYIKWEWPVCQNGWSLSPMAGKRVNSHRALRGVRGRRVKTDKPRNLGGPRNGCRGSRTAHSSGEAGNDRGAKGLNVNEQL